MMRSIITGVIALAIACAGATAVVLARTPDAPAPAHADSATHTADTAKAESAHPPTTSDSALSTHAPDAPVAGKDSVARDTSHAKPAAHTSLSDAPPTASAPATITAPKLPLEHTALRPDGRLTKMFTAMSARDAAKVLEQMSDADITAILSGLAEKRAGEILALLPAARSAAIAKGVLSAARPPQ